MATLAEVKQQMIDRLASIDKTGFDLETLYKCALLTSQIASIRDCTYGEELVDLMGKLRPVLAPNDEAGRAGIEGVAM